MLTLSLCLATSSFHPAVMPVSQPPAAQVVPCSEILARYTDEFDALSKKLKELTEQQAQRPYDEFIATWKKALRPHLLRADQMGEECWRATGSLALMDNDTALASHAYEALTRLAPPGLPADFKAALKEGMDTNLLARIPEAREVFARTLKRVEAAGSDAKDADLCDIAEAYVNGEAIPKDQAAANDYFTKASDKGNARAMWRLGARIQIGVGCDKADRAKGLALMVRSAEAGEPTGLLYAGRILIAGEPAEQDKAKGVAFLARGADAGDPLCAYALARFYHSGESLPKDHSKALALARKAAPKNLDACLLAATILRDGSAGKPDPKAAVPYLQTVIDGNDEFLRADACCVLGDMLIKGEGFDKPDHDGGIEHLTRAIDEGHSSALLLLAHHYASGTYLPQDEERAVQLWAMGDNAQINEATYLLSIAYRQGNGVERDQDHADKLLARAAEAGFPKALADRKKASESPK